jgi:hypothetical protein
LVKRVWNHLLVTKYFSAINCQCPHQYRPILSTSSLQTDTAVTHIYHFKIILVINVWKYLNVKSNVFQISELHAEERPASLCDHLSWREALTQFPYAVPQTFRSWFWHVSTYTSNESIISLLCQGRWDVWRTWKVRGRKEMQTGLWWGNPKERDNFEDSGVESKIILKRILEKQDRKA